MESKARHTFAVIWRGSARHFKAWSSHFEQACRYAAGAIIGSAFIKALGQANNPTEAANSFIQSINNTVSIP